MAGVAFAYKTPVIGRTEIDKLKDFETQILHVNLAVPSLLLFGIFEVFTFNLMTDFR